ncbi:MAG: EAL domain-containing protein [Zoogloeaceae bacterium]|jgi:diguanylate cyclase (GGDEF)-like protein/PAS domain S-box-containing protein|nr:EAL domain-containing protein [Zoogloeaceae bacterium]
MYVFRLKNDILLDINKEFERELSRRRADIIGKNILEIGMWQSERQYATFKRRLLDSKKTLDFATEFIDIHGQARHVALNAHIFTGLDDDEQLAVVSIHDRTGQKQAENLLIQENNRFRDLVYNLRDGVARLDRNNYFIETNPAFLNALGYTLEEIKRLRPVDITPDGWYEQDNRFEETLRATSTGEFVVYEKEQVRKDGTRFPVELQLYLYRNEEGKPDGMWGVVRDLSEKTQQQKKLDFLAYHDLLTGLPNRILFMEHFGQAIERVRHNENQKLALLFINLDHFKTVNETLGHQTGDALLNVVAGRLQKQLRGSDMLARLSSDEFIILLEDSVTEQSVSIVVGRLHALFEQPMLLREQEIYLTASVGVSFYPDDGDNVDELLKRADIAMHKAKELGRNTWQFYRHEMNDDIVERLRLSNSLRNALRHDEFQLHYQPLLDISTGKLAGVESLVRWKHPELGLLLPEHFIPLAEDVGILGNIDNWVLQEACRQMRSWLEKGFEVPRIAVNISVQQLERSGFVDFVRQQLEKNGLRPELLELEVTETTLMQRFGNSLKNLRDLRDLGVSISVDDFGTGYSSLGNLKKMPVHQLKIDRSFICDIGRDKNDETIASALIAIAKSLNLEIVAEGIESQEQEDFLLSEGCQIVQGFYYAKAMPPDRLLAQWNEKKSEECASE